MHGNGPPTQVEATWRRMGKVPEAKLLMDQQPVRLLRALGWTVSSEVSDDYLLRVYDTRLESSWMQKLLQDTGVSGPSHVVGGDFLTAPLIDDGKVISDTKVASWGPPGQGPCHFFIPPRPHQAEWLDRAQRQLSVEAPGSEITVSCIVPREGCHSMLDVSCVRRLVPASARLLEDPTLQLEVTAVA